MEELPACLHLQKSPSIYLFLHFSSMLGFALHSAALSKLQTHYIWCLHISFVPAPFNLQETESSGVGPESPEGPVYQEFQTTRHLPGDSFPQMLGCADGRSNKFMLQGGLLLG